MRNMRGALWALGFAGAAYVWRNRDKLQQQFRQSGSRSEPRQLPDFGANQQSWTSEDQSRQLPREGEAGGSQL